MLTVIACSAACAFALSVPFFVFLWSLARMSKMQEQQQDDTEAYLRLTTDFQKGDRQP